MDKAACHVFVPATSVVQRVLRALCDVLCGLPFVQRFKHGLGAKQGRREGGDLVRHHHRDGCSAGIIVFKQISLEQLAPVPPGAATRSTVRNVCAEIRGRFSLNRIRIHGVFATLRAGQHEFCNLLSDSLDPTRGRNRTRRAGQS